MKKKEDIEQKTEELAEPYCKDFGFELVDTDFVKEGNEFFLRIFIDKPGGITINDCEKMSRAFNEVLDEKEYIDYAYTFEVSSPGLTRQLKKEKDYIRSIGKLTDVKLYKKQGDFSGFTGVLKSYDDGVFTFTPEQAQDDIKLEKAEIADIRLAYVDND